MEKCPLPLYKLVCVATDTCHCGIVALCRKMFLDFVSFHCVLHQHALCEKMLNLNGIIDIAFKIVNSISSRSLQRRLLKIQLEENKSEYRDLLLHTDVRWLSRGGLFLKSARSYTIFGFKMKKIRPIVERKMAP